MTVIRILDGTYGPASANVLQSGAETVGSSSNVSFTLTTLSDGAIMNNSGSCGLSINGEVGQYTASLDKTQGSNNILLSGSKHNIRWEVSSKNNKQGTFTLLIRRGDDSNKRKVTLESWNNLSLDPKSNNYISRRIGDSKWTLRDGGSADPYLQMSGSYPNKSKYVRVGSVANTIDYLDENGSVRTAAASASLPLVGSGSNISGNAGQFGSGASGSLVNPSYAGTFRGGSNGIAGYDALGNVVTSSAGGIAAGNYSYYDEISNTNTQGFGMASGTGLTAYTDALNLLKNQDEYDINLVLLPGLCDNFSNHQATITKAIDVCEDRGDCFVLVDPVGYGYSLTDATTRGDARDTNYASMYWPWVQVPDNQAGTTRWVPPSVVMSGVYAFNDKVAHPWFAPAGLNRGGIDTAIQAERKLTHSNRDDLYESNINPIATFPGQGIVAWGQKTLQKKPSALDRVNVRRLLIKLKKFIASTSRFLVFEQNTSATRNRFLNIVNPYLEQVQSNSGLNAFKVIMDDTNNTPDVVDRNILYGQIFVQPTRTAEFIVLDFTVQPTGATFPE